MTRQEIVDAFMKGDIAKGGGALWSTGNKLMSYGTCIAEWDDTTLLFNRTKYSVTTSTHQGMVPKYTPIRFVDDVKRGTRSLA